MKKLFSPFLDKETFYEPMVGMRDKYKILLENWGTDSHGAGKTDEDKKRYEEQYKCIVKMCEVYEKEPVNTNVVFELMNEIKEYGSPPEEIIKEVAPGMEGKLDGNGLFSMFGGGGLGNEGGGVGGGGIGGGAEDRLPTPEELEKECCLM
eukprot:TRINITY_DN471_c0_g1_i1.p2 TRINITY_DN471_c0_g1~~TRINITY_DN471_c0_g1_i1.p2  ORF type:complete len:150 (-),score=57.20 TRINITY_DN471_c0_g1_i1:46-495(-)